MENISNANSYHAMLNAVKLLNQRQYENPSVEDTTGKLVTNPDQTLEIISGFFKDNFQNKDLPNITSFQGPPKKLNKPITPEEVRKSLESLKNNRAPGEDEISGELLKYGTPTLHGIIANVLNRVFGEHASLKINSGELIAVQNQANQKAHRKI